MIAFPGRLGFFDHARMVEDLRSLGGPIEEAAARGQVLRPPLALLERCGADILFASPADLGARALQADAGLQAWLAAQEFGRACDGDVPLSWLAAAAALGRRDLRPRFRDGDGLDADAMLRWLVLHGIVEHGLFALATPRFLNALLRPGRRPLAPLARLLLAERPDLRPRVEEGAAGMPPGLLRWLAEGGVAEYGLHWAVPAAWQGRGLALPPGWVPPAAAPSPPASPAPAFAGRACHLHLAGDGPLPTCVSDRALSRALGGEAAVHAGDLALRLPRPPSRAAVLLVRGALLEEVAAGPELLVALDGTRPLGAARLDGHAGTLALVLRDLPPGPELVLRLCRTAPGASEDRPWALWRDIWLFAA